MAIRRETLTLVRRSRADVDAEVDAAARNLTAAWVKAWDGLAPGLERTLKDLVSEAPEGRGVTRVQIRKDEQLQLAMGRVSRSLRDLTMLTRTDGVAAAKEVIRIADEAQRQIIASQLPKDHRQLAESRAGDLADLLTRASRRIAVLSRALPDHVESTMRRTIARIAMARLRPDTSQMLLKQTEAAFNVGLARALVIVRTEVLDAHRQAASIAQSAQADVLSGWIWIARLDRWTCSACFSMHGSVHPLDQMGPDGHQQCRCQRAPKAKSWKELGIDIGLTEPDDLVPDAMAIFRSMPREHQLQIMGPTRLDLLDRGRIEWGDLATERQNPGWRRSFVPTPVNRLLSER